MSIAYIGIGSNKGDRLAQIERAVALVERGAGCRSRLSPVIETEAWGFESSHRFLNIVIEIEWSGTAHELLNMLQASERMIDESPHRDASGEYIDRRIDIDLIALGDEIVNDPPTLIVPHPQMLAREFVTTPLKALAPRWRHPLTGKPLG